jgi:hypothetical protein
MKINERHHAKLGVFELSKINIKIFSELNGFI